MTRRKLFTILILLGICFVVSLSVFPLLPRDERTLNAVGAVDGLLENRPAPDFSLRTFAGETVRLADYQGELIYLNFWAEFCDTCRTEMPSLQAFAQEFSHSVSVVTIAIDDNSTLAQEYLARAFPNGHNFDVLLDPGGVTARWYGTVAVPETYVITTEGAILARLVGPQDFLSAEHFELARAVSAVGP